jgi:transposase InsO family protein
VYRGRTAWHYSFCATSLAWAALQGAKRRGSVALDRSEVSDEIGDAQLDKALPLPDNGSAYTAIETRNFATALNLVPCSTPVRSPQSNGISESFVKTFKRDYARVNPLPDADTALRQITGWFEDYNTSHPHSGLNMRSPREFIAAQSQ